MLRHDFARCLHGLPHAHFALCDQRACKDVSNRQVNAWNDEQHKANHRQQLNQQPRTNQFCWVSIVREQVCESDGLACHMPRGRQDHAGHKRVDDCKGKQLNDELPKNALARVGVIESQKRTEPTNHHEHCQVDEQKPAQQDSLRTFQSVPCLAQHNTNIKTRFARQRGFDRAALNHFWPTQIRLRCLIRILLIAH